LRTEGGVSKTKVNNKNQQHRGTMQRVEDWPADKDEEKAVEEDWECGFVLCYANAPTPKSHPLSIPPSPGTLCTPLLAHPDSEPCLPLGVLFSFCIYSATMQKIECSVESGTFLVARKKKN